MLLYYKRINRKIMPPMSMQLFQTGLQYQYFSKAILAYSMQGTIIFSRKKTDAKLIRNHRRRLTLSSAILNTCLHRSGSRAKSTNKNNSYALCGNSNSLLKHLSLRLWLPITHTDTHALQAYAHNCFGRAVVTHVCWTACLF